MERELWGRVYRLVRSLGRPRRRDRVRLPDAAVVLAYLWAVLHDRPTGWACDPRNRAGLPSGAEAAGVAPGVLVKRVDGKPLPVGGHSDDPDAKNGRAAGGMAKGYKLHAVRGTTRSPAPGTCGR